MRIEQYYLECLSQASYLIADDSSGLAAVIDPRRDVEEYLADAAEQGLQIRYVIETHFHADFLSGHLELAAATGAEIIFGDAAAPGFPARLVHDGERIVMGETELEFLATPGHTPESISIVVRDLAGVADGARPDPLAVFTGDTLFIGDVGRPDLLASVGVSAAELGASLYDSLHHKLMALPDATLVYPAHGAGSACGKNLSTETVSTIGRQRVENYALAPMAVEDFVALVSAEQTAAPDYFAYAATTNRDGHDLLASADVPEVGLAGARELAADGAVLLDVRSAADFAAGHLAGSVNVGLDGRFAEFVGMVVGPLDRVVVLTSDGDQAAEAALRMARIGFDRVVAKVVGVEAALAADPAAATVASRLTATALRERRAQVGDLCVVDIRNDGERALDAIDHTVHIPLAELPRRVGELDLDRPIVVHCAGGYRSSIAASWLRSQGARDVSDLLGGIAAWRSTEQLVG
ncbi:MAG: MBL fold metallo-hydrolase [Actinomycetota bacterium]|nr:MBL fold metallo-hydrolase [Actinomycetota bacterium]